MQLHFTRTCDDVQRSCFSGCPTMAKSKLSSGFDGSVGEGCSRPYSTAASAPMATTVCDSPAHSRRSNPMTKLKMTAMACCVSIMSTRSRHHNAQARCHDQECQLRNLTSHVFALRQAAHPERMARRRGPLHSRAWRTPLRRQHPQHFRLTTGMVYLNLARRLHHRSGTYAAGAGVDAC